MTFITMSSERLAGLAEKAIVAMDRSRTAQEAKAIETYCAECNQPSWWRRLWPTPDITPEQALVSLEYSDMHDPWDWRLRFCRTAHGDDYGRMLGLLTMSRFADTVSVSVDDALAMERWTQC